MESNFYFEKPIDSAENDEYGFDTHAITVAETLLQMSLHESYTLSINGEWGSGKTSFVNLIIKHIEESIKLNNEKIIIINFDTSLFQNSNEMISEYFKQVFSILNKEKKINKSNEFHKLVKSFIAYGNKISLSFESFSSDNFLVTIWKKIKSIYDIWFNQSESQLTLQESKNKLSELLLKSKYRFIVIIDDIDRLQKKQVRHIFQLIYSLCKLPNHTFILPFDKRIISNCINKVYGFKNGETYIEKIIQREINVPEISEQKIKEKLYKVINNSGIKIDFSKNEYYITGYKICIKPLIKTIRDLNRLCDNFIFLSNLTSAILNQFDLLILTAIKLKTPYLYEYISKNRFRLAAGHNPKKIIQNVQNDNTGGNNQSSIDSFGTLREELENYRIVEEKDQKYAKKVLDFLFPYFYEYYDGERECFDGVKIEYMQHEHHISNIDYINSFFSSEFRDDLISFSQLDDLLTKYNRKKLFDYISSIVDTTMCESILVQIKSYVTNEKLDEEQKKILSNAFAELYDFYGLKYGILYGIFRTVIEEYSDEYDSTLVHLEYIDEDKLSTKVKCLSKYLLYLDDCLDRCSPNDLGIKISNLRINLFYQIKDNKNFSLFYNNGNNDIYKNLKQTMGDCSEIQDHIYDFINNSLENPDNMIGFILSDDAKQKWWDENKYSEIIPTDIHILVENEFPMFTNIESNALQCIDNFLKENSPEKIGAYEYQVLSSFEDRFKNNSSGVVGGA